MSKSSVTVLENNFGAIRKSVTGKQLERAALAGGYVIEGYAKINVNQTFSSKSTGGAGLGGRIPTVISESSNTSAWTDTGPTVIYGRIQELGGIIKPVFAKMLSWIGDDKKRIFAKMVTLPARPYLRPAADEHKPDILQAIGTQLKKQIEGAAG